MMKKENIPNILSVFRLFLIIVFVFFIFYDFPKYCIAAAAVYLVAGITDVLDGWLARKCGWVTRTGKILDPIADKLFQMTVLVCLSAKFLLPVWLIIPFILKELLQLTLGFLMMKKRNVVVHSSWYGKAATVALCAAGLLVLALADKIEEYKFYINMSYIIILIYMLIVMALYIAKYINVKSDEDNVITHVADIRK
jgi:cardiolipin synthase